MEVNKRIWIVGLLTTLALAGCSPAQSASKGTASGTFVGTTTTVDATLAVRSSATTNGVKPKPLEIVESGYTAIDENHVSFAFVLRNPNPNFGVQCPVVRVTMRDASGHIVGSSDESFGRWLMPGETASLGNEAVTKVRAAKVEFAVVDPAAQSKWRTPQESKDMGFVLKTLPFKAAKSGSGVAFVGAIQNTNAVGVDDFVVSVILRDKAGRIVGGYSGYSDEILPGEKQPFTVRSARPAPKYSTIQAYAQQWI